MIFRKREIVIQVECATKARDPFSLFRRITELSSQLNEVKRVIHSALSKFIS
jgi:hypothetical protein